jgi:serine/threonine protein kinase
MAISPLIQKAEMFRVHNEITACTTLLHDNIIQLHAVRETDTEIELVLNYCKDGDLLRSVNKYGSSESDAKAMMTQLVPALVFAHQSGWAHMDVKVHIQYSVSSQ